MTTHRRSRTASSTVLIEALFDRAPAPALRIERHRGGELTLRAANAAFGRVTQRATAELIGADLRDLVMLDDAALVAELFRSRSHPWNPQVEVRLRSRIGPVRRVLLTATVVDPQDPGCRDFIVHVDDVTARRAAEESVARHSLYDPGTGLLNRTALGDRIDAALHRLSTGAAEGSVGLILLDIDQFTAVSDAWGHSVAERLLALVGERVRATTRPQDAVARVGPDEFAVLVEENSPDGVAVLVGRLHEVLHGALEMEQEPVALSVTFGATVVDIATGNADDVLRQAELALFRAKRAGRGRIEFYAEALLAQSEVAQDLRRELFRAIGSGELAVAYQPIVSLSDGSVVGHEALVRLPTSDGRILAPGAFLELARDAGVLPLLDKMVLDQALSDRVAGLGALAAGPVSVNAEADELRDPEFALKIIAQLHAAAAEPSVLTLEVTESVLMHVDEVVRYNLEALREAGVAIAVDDFGTGYSSLAQLQRLHADVVKIDRSFVTALGEQEQSGTIVSTIIDLAHRMGMVAVAEGIETRRQAETLRRMGCDRGQGYLFGRPTVGPPEPAARVPGQRTWTPGGVREASG